MMVVMMVKLVMLMMIISNLWAAEVCLPARTLRSVFGLWAFLPAALPQVGQLPHRLQRLQLERGGQQHEASHCLSLEQQLWWWCCWRWHYSGGAAAEGLLPINREAAAAAAASKEEAATHYTTHYTPHYTTLHTSAQ